MKDSIFTYDGLSQGIKFSLSYDKYRLKVVLANHC